MFIRFILFKRTTFLSRGFHLGKQFSIPVVEDITFRAVCVNLRQKKWDFLRKVSQSLTNSLVGRVLVEFRDSPQAALDFYNWVGKSSDFSHTLESFCTMIHVLVRARRFDDALSLMGRLMLVNGVSPLAISDGLVFSYETCESSPAVFDTLVRACTVSGSTEDAYKLIKKLRTEGYAVTVHAWNHFMSHLLKLNDTNQFWIAYKEMAAFEYVENVITFNLIIHALSKECKLLEAISVFYRMLKFGIWPNVVTFNMMIDGACRMGDMVLALKLLENIGSMSDGCVSPNCVTYNSIVNGFCKMGNMKFAEKVRKDMAEAGIESNIRTYGALIDAYARIGSSSKALSLCDEMMKNGLMPNTVVCSSILDWLYKEGDVKGALLVVNEMIDKNVGLNLFTYSIVTNGLCTNGHIFQAFKFHEQLLGKNMIEDAFTFNILLHYMCKSKNLSAAKQLLGKMFIHGFAPDLVTYATLIDGHLKEGELETAVGYYNEVIGMMKSPDFINNFIRNRLCNKKKSEAMDSLDPITYNAWLNRHFSIGKIDEVSTLFLEMREERNSVNIVTFNILMKYLCKFGCYEQAKELLKIMVGQGTIPDYITYATLVTCFGKNRNSDEVIELHDYMVLNGVTPDLHAYTTAVRPLLEDKGQV